MPAVAVYRRERGQFADMDGNPRPDIRYVLRSGSMRVFSAEHGPDLRAEHHNLSYRPLPQ